MQVAAVAMEPDPDFLQVSAAVSISLQNSFTVWFEVWVGEKVVAPFL